MKKMKPTENRNAHSWLIYGLNLIDTAIYRYFNAGNI